MGFPSISRAIRSPQMNPQRPALASLDGFRREGIFVTGVAASVLMESEPKLQILVLTRFLPANRHPPTDQVRGHASLENAL